MERRRYITTVSTVGGFLVAGCLGTEQLPVRSFGEKQHRNNIAMAAESVNMTDEIAVADEPLRAEAGMFVLVTFWAENLVDSERHLPTMNEFQLTINNTGNEYEPYTEIEGWQRIYRGGKVEPGVLRYGVVPFRIQEQNVTSGITFTVTSKVSNFSSAAAWTSQ